jgi:Hormone-sensitive lipase (HSL) N-terminus
MDFDEVIDNNASYFEQRCVAISTNLDNLKGNYKNLLRLLDVIDGFSDLYDFDKEIRGNGYRSFVEVCKAHISKCNQICEKLKQERDSVWFSKQKFIK